MSPLGIDLLDAPARGEGGLPLPPPRGLAARALTPGDFALLTALRRAVAAGLPDEDCYVLEPDDFVRDHLGPHGETVGLFAGGRPVAYAMLGLPEAGEPDAMADVLGIPPGERGTVAHLASSMVLPDRRGCGLHKWLIRHRLARCAALGRYRVMAMVSPRNVASWHNLMRHGLAIAALAPLEGARPRYLLHRDLRSPPPVRAAGAECADAVSVPLADLDRQRDLLAEGRQGVGMGVADGGIEVRFGRAR